MSSEKPVTFKDIAAAEDPRSMLEESLMVEPHDQRITRGDLYMGVADLLAKRASCRRGSVGVVGVIQGRIVATGYNGAPANTPDCWGEGCIMLNGHCLRAIHAEANLISWAARTGTQLMGTQLYTTTPPCHACSKLILQSGINAVVYKGSYEENGLKFLKDSGYVHVAEWQPGMEVW